jgi:hypothetical protein
MRRLTLISAAVLVAIIPGAVGAAPGDLISELMPPHPTHRALCGLHVSGLGQNGALVGCAGNPTESKRPRNGVQPMSESQAMMTTTKSV